jgi:hypothetical protein
MRDGNIVVVKIETINDRGEKVLDAAIKCRRQTMSILSTFSATPIRVRIYFLCPNSMAGRMRATYYQRPHLFVKFYKYSWRFSAPNSSLTLTMEAVSL